MKLINYGLSIITVLFIFTAFISFTQGKIIEGVCCIFVVGWNIILWLRDKRLKELHDFFSYIDDGIDKYGAVIITKGNDNFEIRKTDITIEQKEISCSAENNDQISYGHISDNDENK